MNPCKLIADYLDKTKSHLYSIFTFWIVLFHSPIIFTAIFVDQGLLFKKTSMLKNEYIGATYLNVYDRGFWVHEIAVLLLSVGLTYLMIWVLPDKVVKHAYYRELHDQFVREFIAQEEKIASRQEKLESKETIDWDSEYAEFKATNLYNYFGEISESITRYHGYAKDYDGVTGNLVFQIDEDLLAYAYANNLLNLSNDASSTIELTEKGKYFLKKYQIETQKASTRKTG